MKNLIFSLIFFISFKGLTGNSLYCATCEDSGIDRMSCPIVLQTQCPPQTNYQCLDVYIRPDTEHPKGQLQKYCMSKYYQCNVKNGFCTGCNGDLCNLRTTLDYYYKKHNNQEPINVNNSTKVVAVIFDDGTVGTPGNVTGSSENGNMANNDVVNTGTKENSDGGVQVGDSTPLRGGTGVSAGVDVVLGRLAQFGIQLGGHLGGNPRVEDTKVIVVGGDTGRKYGTIEPYIVQ